MEIFGALERLLASLYPYRVPLGIAVAVVVTAAAWAAGRRGWHRPLLRLVRARPLPSAIAAAVLLAVALPAGNYLLSPLWTSSTLHEESPLVAAAVATSGGASGPTATVGAGSGASSAGAGPRVVARGMFAGADEFHFGRGDAVLIETAPRRHTLRFEDFSVRNGPDLFVYLSDSATGYGSRVLKVGRLRATDGAFNYELPEGTDISAFRSAIVWCEQFAVLFATAPLK